MIIACTSAVTVVCGSNLAQYSFFLYFSAFLLPSQDSYGTVQCLKILISLAFFPFFFLQFNSSSEMVAIYTSHTVWRDNAIVAISKSMFISFFTLCFRSVSNADTHIHMERAEHRKRNEKKNFSKRGKKCDISLIAMVRKYFVVSQSFITNNNWCGILFDSIEFI